ncbi:spermidine synthase [Phytoactinopolyspora mesophila]|uniref:Spermidine synthase n=1 Tax=Phytoactinopolyspora mesophila TaxID=2650750 RepID=A0A7K3LXR4_9ACTN|nr:spermidine synthase [Phytoactinopolyspora mesophila]NDL55821.1 spermidine synthase [Phytoactinopolyspora mesophila]
MSARLEELDWRSTPWGEISLRRRWDPVFDAEVYEIKLDDDFLMSSMFTAAEIEMVRLALADTGEREIDVVVGGLGLGYTAQTVLEYSQVRSLAVIEAVGEVVEWHQSGLIPAGATLTSDDRCRLVHGDFFALLRDGGGLDPADSARRFHAVVVDIDHSPRHVLHPSHADFYTSAGLGRLAACLHEGGIFSLWSNDPPDDEFIEVLATVFRDVRAEVVRFDNPLQDHDATNTVYLARV